MDVGLSAASSPCAAREQAKWQRRQALMAGVRGAQLRDRYRRAAQRASGLVSRSVNAWLAAHGMESDGDGQTDHDVLGLVLEKARALFGGCDSASLTVVEQLGGEQPPYRTAVATGIAGVVDAAQYRLGEGPCVEAIELDMIAVVWADDLSAPQEAQDWPRFSQAARELGVRSTLSIAVPWTPLGVGLHPEHRTLGAINLYAGEPHAFGAQERDGTLLACWAGGIVSGRNPADLLGARD